MIFSIFCPNCSHDFKQMDYTESGEPHEFYCVCELPFAVALLEVNDQERKIHDGIIFKINITSENQDWVEVDSRLLPCIHCVLCKTKLNRNQSGELYCSECGCKYDLDMEVSK